MGNIIDWLVNGYSKSELFVDNTAHQTSKQCGFQGKLIFQMGVICGKYGVPNIETMVDSMENEKL